MRAKSRLPRAGEAAALLALFCVGCATSRPAEGQKAEALQQTIEKLRVQNAAYARQVEELENRVFILSDRLDAKGAAGRQETAAPALPRVQLVPGQEAPVTEPGEPVTSPEPGVEYAGEAARPSSRRPLLRLHGDELPLLSSREPAVASAAPVAAPAPPRPAPAKRPERIEAADAGPADGYTLALAALRAGRHDEAVEGFRSFLRQHPKHEHADNAQYWLGECFYDRQDYPNAVREFRRVVDKYPLGNKVADALLKIGFSQIALGSAETGRQTLAEVVRSFPKHEAAARASARLQEIERVGRGLPASGPALSRGPSTGEERR